MLMNEDDFEIDTGSRDGLQGLKQEDPILKDEGKLRPGKNLGPQEEQVDGRSCIKQAIVYTTTKEAAIFDCGHVVNDSTNETMYMYW